MSNPTHLGQPKKLDPLAVAQLKAWEIIARQYPLTVVIRNGQLHLICVADRQTVFPLADREKRGYRFSVDIVLAALVAHMRERHRELDPDNG